MTLDLPERFESKISPEPNTGCWLWTGAVRADGYGIAWFRNSNQYAHRTVYTHLRCDPGASQLDHLCRVRCCVNPDHLEVVTQKINTQRGLVGVAHKAMTHCRRGHEFTPENTRADFSRGVWCRQCRMCDKLRAAKKRENR